MALQENAGARNERGLSSYWIADVDVHVDDHPLALVDHSDPPWRESLRELAHVTPRYLDIPGFSIGWEGIDPPIPGRHADGDPIAGHPDWETRSVKTARQLRSELDSLSIDAAIIIPDNLLTLAALPNGAWAAAIARAYNRWLIAEWLEAERDLFGAVVAVPHDPAAAAREIRRHAAHPRVVAVFLPTACVSPLWGHRMYDAIYEAAEETGLPVLFHSVAIIHPNFPHNVQTIEPMGARHALVHPLGMMANLVSLIGTGVPVRFPDLKIVFTEAGISWIPFVAWKLDKEYTERRREFPFYPEPPSHYVKRCYFATQPIEEPENPRALVQLMEILDLKHRVMFASDWPHHDFDHPRQLLKLPLPREERQAIYGGTARTVFGLPTDGAA